MTRLDSSAVLGADPGAREDEAASTGTASGKAILFGEHAVVYGHPAIAVPLRALSARADAVRVAGPSTLHSTLFTGPLHRAPERLGPTVTAITATLAAVGTPGDAVAVRVRSDIPAERGVGSSAAVAGAVVAAVAGAVGAHLTADERHELIQAAERAAHGSPSGLDARAVVSAGPLWFHGGVVSPLPATAPVHLVIADSGVKGRTREAVGAVRAHLAARPDAIGAAIDALGGLSAFARDALALGALDDLGDAMDEAHELLGVIGVGDPALDHLVSAARAGGARGAKLTGGGRGGCVLALAQDEEHAVVLAERLRRAGAPAAWRTEVERTT